MLKRVAVAVVAVVFAAGAYHAVRVRMAMRRNPVVAVKPAQLAPSLSFVDLSGSKIETSNYAGKVMLVNFWAAWCTACADEVPQLVAMQDKYGGQGFQIIGVSMEDRDSVLREFYRSHNMNYPVVPGNDKVAQAYGGILGLPTTFLIGRDGQIHAKLAGVADFGSLDQEVNALLRMPAKN